MIPFDLKVSNSGRVHISFESLFWFFVVTAAATTLGTYAYTAWVEPYAEKQGWLPGGTAPPPRTALPATAMPTAPLGYISPARRLRRF